MTCPFVKGDQVVIRNDEYNYEHIHREIFSLNKVYIIEDIIKDVFLVVRGSNGGIQYLWSWKRFELYTPPKI